jgi:Putative Flp pilus-assembly TadE/G-like
MSRTTHPRGNVLPLVALCLAVLSGFAGLSVDVGYWEYRQQAQQSAADSAAIGGAQQLAYAGCPNSTTAQSSGRADAANNAFSNSVNTTVTVDNPPASGPFAGDNCAVNVTITTSHVSSFFTRMFGFGGGSGGAQETTQATATLTSQGAGCIYMLQIGQNTNFNSSNVVAPYCSILLNGSANFHGSTVDAAGIGEYNYAGSNNGGTFTQASPVPILPVADPCPEIAGCAYLTSNPPSTSPCTGTYGGGATISPGCYNNINLNKATVTFSPGLYVLPGSANLNQANITANGVTIYVPSGASINFNKANNLVLTAPTTGNTAGVAYFQSKSNLSDVNFNSSGSGITGLIYAPSATMNYNGSASVYTVIVAGYANFNLSSGQDFASPAPGQSPLVQRAVLGE